MRQAVPLRFFSASAAPLTAAQQQFNRMESLYQGYFSATNQRKIICIGRNYKAHIAELNNDTPTEPMWFDKPMTSLLKPGSPLKLVPGLHDDIHHEIELGVVIGMNGRNIKPENALKHIAGFFIGLDFTNRSLQQVNKDAGADWVLAKGANDFAAVSEFIHKSAVTDVDDVQIELQVNGETRQHANTSQMIYDVPTMIADFSRFQELREGDLLLTGTPEGVDQVKAGDSLLCCLRNGDGDELVRLELDIV